MDLNLSSIPDPNYSVVGKMRHLSKSAAKDRINSIRMQSAKLIGYMATGHHRPTSDDISISAYNAGTYFKDKEAEAKLQPEVVAEALKVRVLEDLNSVPENANEDILTP